MDSKIKTSAISEKADVLPVVQKSTLTNELPGIEKRILKSLIKITQHAKTLDTDSIDYSVAIEELSDCVFLLEHGCDSDSISKIINSTTNEELCDILSGKKKYAVIIEEHIASEFHVYADNLEAALKTAQEQYDRGELVVEPSTPNCRMMIARDEETGIDTGWRDF